MWEGNSAQKADFSRSQRIQWRGEVEGELNGRIVDKYAAAQAAELIAWSALCAHKDAKMAAEVPFVKPNGADARAGGDDLSYVPHPLTRI